MPASVCASRKSSFMSSMEGPPRGIMGRAWHNFSMQQIQGYHPIVSVRSSIILYLSLGSAMVIIGAILVWIAYRQVEVEVRYDALGELEDLNSKESAQLLINKGIVDTSVSIPIKKDMPAPIHIYYKLDDFFQNHKRYVRSHQDSQLHGLNISAKRLAACQPQEILSTQQLSKNEILEVKNNGVINPCGLAAWSYFNDTFTEFAVTASLSGKSEPLSVDSSRLVWSSDRDTLFGNYKAENHNKFEALKGGAELKLNVSKDEHFMAWMKYSVAPSVRKYWGKIDRDLLKGETVTLTVGNSFNTYNFNGKKWIILTTSSALGGRNPTFGVVWLTGGLLWLVIAGIYLIAGAKHMIKRNDKEKIAWLQSRLSWN